MNTKLFDEMQEKVKKTKAVIYQTEKDIQYGRNTTENTKILFVLQTQLATLELLIELYNLNIHIQK